VKLTIATRGSKLALWQAHHIKDRLMELDASVEIDLKIVVTKGDKILDTPLALIGGKGLFTKEIEDTMIRGEAQLAVHSLKDMPTESIEGLRLTAITKRQDVRDAMLSQKYASIEELPSGAVVGTTSLRRRMQLINLRPDLKIKELRGNVDTRIRKMKDGEYDAIILAAAGINRLGLRSDVKYVYEIDIHDMIPSMGQGALGIETVHDEKVVELVSKLNDEASMVECVIERDFVKVLEGGCTVPIGVSAKLLENGDVMTKAVVGLPDGTEELKDTLLAKKERYKDLGKELANRMIDRGAKELLERAAKIAFK